MAAKALESARERRSGEGSGEGRFGGDLGGRTGYSAKDLLKCASSSRPRKGDGKSKGKKQERGETKKRRVPSTNVGANSVEQQGKVQVETKQRGGAKGEIS